MTTKNLKVLLLCVVVLILGWSVDAGELTVVGPRALTGALKEIAHFFEQQHPDTKVSLRTENSVQVVRLLELGTPIDVVCVADEKHLQNLRDKNLLEKGSEIRLGSNELVVVAPESSKLEIKDPKDLVPKELNKVVFYPENSAIQEKVKTYLTRINLLDALKDKKAEMKDTRAAIAALTKGEVDWAFVYSDDAADQKGLKIIWRVPSTEIPPVVYFGSIARSSTQKPNAKSFLDSTQSTISQKILENAGFSLAPVAIASPQTQITQTQPAEKKKKSKAEKKTEKKEKKAKKKKKKEEPQTQTQP
jgi:molybdate transport system substrate-binding protein